MIPQPETPRGSVVPAGGVVCPDCGRSGTRVKPITLRALLQPHLHGAVDDEDYGFCPHPGCDLVYFHGDGRQAFVRADLTVLVGSKETDPPRPVCYCFGHSVESLQEEWEATGRSSVLEAIKAELKAGNCRCEVMNPMGGCCLGEVVKVLKGMPPAAEDSEPVHDCCAPRKPTPS